MDATEAHQASYAHYIAHVDQRLELLTGVSAGNAETPDTVRGLVNARLQRLARDMTAFGENRSNRTQRSDEVNAISAETALIKSELNALAELQLTNSVVRLLCQLIGLGDGIDAG